MTHPDELNRIDALMFDDALDWLEPDDAEELARLRTAGAVRERDADSVHQLVSQFMLASDEPQQPLPAHLRSRLMRDAQQRAADLAGAPRGASISMNNAGGARPAQTEVPNRWSMRSMLTAGLVSLAAAAAILLWTGVGSDLLRTAPAPVPHGSSSFALLAERTSFVERVRDVRQVHLRTGDDGPDMRVVGEIVYSVNQRSGFCTMRHLEINEQQASRYELYLRDAVTGMLASAGVFDITERLCDTIIRFELPDEVGAPDAFFVVLAPANAPGSFAAASVIASATTARL